MTFRLVQPPRTPTSPTVVLWLVGAAVDPDLRAALPGACVVASDGHQDRLATALGLASASGRKGGPVALVGYSAGCQAVRHELRDGVDPCAVLAIDGIHASMPVESWQIDTWARYAERARNGQRLMIATCTQQTYTETLPEPFMATVSVLRQVTGWALAHAGALPYGTMTSQGSLHVHNYASARIDAKAHRAQMTTVLPAMLRMHIAPWLASAIDCPDLMPVRTFRRGDTGEDVRVWQERLLALGYDPGTPDGAFGPATEYATRQFQKAAGLAVDGIVGTATQSAAVYAVEPPPPRSHAGLADAVLRFARADIGRGEVPSGSNDGEYVRRLFDGTGVTPPANYCAAAVRFWIRLAASSLGIAAPILCSVGARATMAQFQAARRWRTAAELRADPSMLRPGMVPIWDRSDPTRPETAWWGHEGVASTASGTNFTSIEANAGDEVAAHPHRLDDPRLLGAGWLD